MRKSLLKSMLIAGMLAVGMNVQAKVDITDTYLTNADLTSLDGWDFGDEFNNGTFNYTDWNVNMDVPVIEFYHSWTGNANQVGQPVSPTKNFHFTQTITLPAGDYRIAVNALYREGNGNGTNTKAYIFAGEKQQLVYGITGAENSEIVNAGRNDALVKSDMGGAAYLFSQGRFSNEFDFTLSSEQTIEVGFRGYIDTYCSWCILGPVKLYQYELSDYIADYNEKVGEAETLYNTPMSDAVLNALKAAVKDPSSFTTSEQVANALQVLNEAINAANQNITMRAEATELIEGQIMSVEAKSNLQTALNGTNEELGQAIIDARASIALYQQVGNILDVFEMNSPEINLSDIRSQYENGNLTISSIDEIYPIIQEKAIQGLGTGAGTDYTPAIINPSFEFGNTTGWTYEPSGDSGAKENSNATYTVDITDGDYLFNIWSSGNAVSQTIDGLPNGLYLMSAIIATDAGHQVRLFANDAETIVDASEGGKGVGVIGKVLVNVTYGQLTIGAEGVNKWWYKVDDFHLIYNPDASEFINEKVIEAQELLSEKMSATAKDALQNAINNVPSDALQAIESLNEAITAAKASIADYKVIENYIISISEQDTDVDIFDMQDAYDEGQYETVEDLYTIYQKAKIALLPKTDGTDYTSAIINPSFEFDTDGAVDNEGYETEPGGMAFGWTFEPSTDSGVKNNSKMPYTIDIADGNFVFNIWQDGNPISQTIKGLPNGEYELSAVIASTEGYQVKLFANNVVEIINASDSGENYGVSGSLTVTVTNGTLTIGAEGGELEENGTTRTTWYKVDDFRLTLVKATGESGDVTGDGAINSSDVQRVYYLMAKSATPATNPEGDVNLDGYINSGDIQRIYAIMASQSAK